jgi:hypothetical protein
MNCTRSRHGAIHLSLPSRLARYVVLVVALSVFGMTETGAQGAATQPSPATTSDAKAAYLARLAEYEAARRRFEALAQPYWASIAAKRTARRAKRARGEAIVADDYVLDQPPVYSGPAKPVDPNPEPEKAPQPPKAPIPVVADFLRNALEQFQFVPKTAEEIEFKQAYADTAAAAGLTRNQAVRIYGFEAGGDGKYDVQAGLEYDRPGAHAISTALGYNQLLTTNTIDLLVEHGDDLLKALKAGAARSDTARKAELEQKIAIVGQMIRFSKSVPDEWSEQEKLGMTPGGLGVHALNLDIDVGPLLQTWKLIDSVNFARRKGFGTPLTAAELEMMNLTGDGSGFDMISIPLLMRSQVPTSNFFQRNGYERNPVAIRNNTVATLLAATDAKMDKEAQLRGAKDLAAAFPK